MGFEDFKELFLRSLETADDNAETVLGREIPRNYRILLYGAGHGGDILEVDEVANLLFIDESNFHRIIDVAVQQVSPDESSTSPLR